MCASIYVCVLDVLGWRGGNGQTCSKVVTTATEGMGQRVAMAPRSQGQGVGPGGLSFCSCMYVCLC